jgi:hypothetical protein
LIGGIATSDPISNLGAAEHTISAVYSGDDTFGTNTSGDLIQVIAKAHLAVTADSQDMNHGDAVPTLTWKLSGFVNGDGADVVQGSPALATSANPSSSAGRYPITVGSGTLNADNYDFPDLVNGQLTVHPKVVDIRVRYGSKSMSLLGLNRDLPFTTISAFDVLFSDDVNVNLGQLALTGSNVSSYGFTGLTYNPITNEATFKLPTALGVDRLMMALSGETFATDSTIGVSPLELTFAVLPGDINGDRGVNLTDALLVQSAAQGKGDPSLIGWSDVDGDGVVDINDFNAVRKRVGSRLG